MLRFENRTDAGRRLATRLAGTVLQDPVVLALPRGGVPVACEVAEALKAPLDVILVRKLGAPGFSELGIGAVVDGATPRVVLNEEVMHALKPTRDYVEDEKIRQLEVIDRRRKLYRQGRRPVPLEGRTVIVVDDGMATGGTASAALAGLSDAGVARLILAVPVAPPAVLDRLAPQADEVLALSAPAHFRAVGDHYEDFTQVADEKVIALLRRAADRQKADRDAPAHG